MWRMLVVLSSFCREGAIVLAAVNRDRGGWLRIRPKEGLFRVKDFLELVLFTACHALLRRRRQEPGVLLKRLERFHLLLVRQGRVGYDVLWITDAEGRAWAVWLLDHEPAA